MRFPLPSRTLRSRLQGVVAAVCAVALGSAGCVGLKVATTGTNVDQQIRTAKAIGAVRCDGQGLAIAEANYDFAAIELGHGNDERANAHMSLAASTIEKTIKNSWPCAPDEDKDGTPDIKDKCPKVAGPKENEGCPWPDEDKDGTFDKDDKCPKVPGPKENKGCPWPDSDKDGITDNLDRCPNEPEDFDGFEDEEGCPDTDNDKDTVADSIDRCPMDQGTAANQGCPVGDRDGDGIMDDQDACPEVPGLPEFKGCPPPDKDNDGVPDFIDKCPDEYGPIEEQGCPKKYSMVVVHHGNIEITQQVHFATNKFVILPDSFALLKEVARAINDNPKFQIEVDGHTDSKAADDFNLTLSQKRAEAVRDYLVNVGKVPVQRLAAKGYGETCPLQSNLTETGRATNRRVEFIITNSGEPHPCAGTGK